MAEIVSVEHDPSDPRVKLVTLLVATAEIVADEPLVALNALLSATGIIISRYFSGSVDEMATEAIQVLRAAIEQNSQNETEGLTRQ